MRKVCLYTSVFLVLITVLATSVVKAETLEATATPLTTTEKTESSIRERLETGREARQEKMDAIRADAKTKLEERKAEFKANLKNIKDEKKKVVLERMVGKFDTLNTKWTTHWKTVLDRLSSVLSKMDTRARNLSQEGVDITTYTRLSADAKDKISKASAALDAQTANTYVFEVTTDSALKGEVKNISTEFRQDMSSTHEMIRVARTAVGDTFTVLKELGGAKNETQQ